MLEHLIGISLKGFKVASFRFIIHRLTFAPLAVSKTLIAPHPDEFAREERVARDKSWEEEEREGVSHCLHPCKRPNYSNYPPRQRFLGHLSLFFLSFFLSISLITPQILFCIVPVYYLFFFFFRY